MSPQNDPYGDRSGSATTTPRTASQAREAVAGCRICFPPHSSIMPGKGSKGNLDPSRGLARNVPGTAAAGRDDPAGLRGFADAAGWRGGAAGAGLGGGTPGCNSDVRDHNARRSETALDSTGKAVAEAPLRRAPPPSIRASGPRQRLPFRGILEPVSILTFTKVAGTPPLPTAGFLPLSGHHTPVPVG
jgi:hypothetical protein